MNKSSFDHIYQEMRKRNTELINNGGLKVDPSLRSNSDTRRGIGLFGFYNSAPSLNFTQLYQQTREHFPNQVIYHPKLCTKMNQGLLHFTFFQYCAVSQQVPQNITQNISQIAELTADILFEKGDFSISFSGLIAVPIGLVLVGYPSYDLNYFRNQLRVSLSEQGLPFQEPYQNNICHSTLLRLSNPENSAKLLQFAQEQGQINLEELNITKLYLSYGSWRMQPTEVKHLYELDLVKKKLLQL